MLVSATALKSSIDGVGSSAKLALLNAWGIVYIGDPVPEGDEPGDIICKNEVRVVQKSVITIESTTGSSVVVVPGLKRERNN